MPLTPEQAAALMGIGTGLLQNAASTTGRPRFGTGLGAGVPMAMGMVAQVQQQQRQKELLEQQRQKAQQEQMAQQALLQAAGDDPVARAAAMSGNVEAALGIIRPKVSGAPQAATDAQGNPILIQTDVYGNVKPLGFSPFKPELVDTGGQIQNVNLGATPAGTTFQKSLSPAQAAQLAMEQQRLNLARQQAAQAAGVGGTSPKNLQQIMTIDPQTGQQVTAFVDKAALARGVPMEQAIVGGIPRAPMKPLDQNAQQGVQSAGNMIRRLADIEQKLDQYGTGVIQGRATRLRGYIGDEGAAQLTNEMNALAADIQSFIKGVPSNYDVQVFQRFMPSMDKSPAQNRAAINEMRKMTLDALMQARQNVAGKGYSTEPFDQMLQQIQQGAVQAPQEAQQSPQAPQQTQQAPVRVQSQEDYAKLPSGSLYIAPDGVVRRKK